MTKAEHHAGLLLGATGLLNRAVASYQGKSDEDPDPLWQQAVKMLVPLGLVPVFDPEYLTYEIMTPAEHQRQMKQ